MSQCIIMNDKDIIDNDCWEGWWLVGATHDDKYHDEDYHGHLSLSLSSLGGSMAPLSVLSVRLIITY